MEGQAGDGADDGAVDPDVLEVGAEQQLEAGGGLLGVPAGDGAADEGGDVAVEVVGQVADAPLDRRLHRGRQLGVVLQPAPAGGDAAHQLPAQLRLGVAGLGPELDLGVGPQRRHPLPHLGLGQQVVLELLAPLEQVDRRLQLGGQQAQAGVELPAQVVVAVGGHLLEHGAGAVEQPVEDAVLDRARQPPRRLGAQLGPQLLAVGAEVPVEAGEARRRAPRRGGRPG